MKWTSDRIFGAVALLSALAIILEARSFQVRFYTDPLGARGLPMIAAALLGLGGTVLMARPRSENAGGSTRTVWVQHAIITTGLFAYAAMLQVFGFLVSTAAVVSILAVVFGGPARRAVLLATLYTVALYVIFFYVLGLRLPIGTIFLRGA